MALTRADSKPDPVSSTGTSNGFRPARLDTPRLATPRLRFQAVDHYYRPAAGLLNRLKAGVETMLEDDMMLKAEMDMLERRVDSLNWLMEERERMCAC